MQRAFLAFAIISLALGCAGETTPKNRTTGLHAIVLRPDRKPAAGASAVLAPTGHWVSVINGRSFDDDPAYQRSTADADGRIRFAGMPSPRVLLVIDAAGYARVDSPELPHLKQIRLRAWGHIKGIVKIGDRPAADAPIVADYPGDGPSDGPVNSYFLVHTGADGRFAMDRVQPGTVLIARQIMWHFGGKTIAGSDTQRRLIKLQPGESAEISLGGTGRPVVGKVELPAQLKGIGGWGFGIATAGPRTYEQSPPMPAEVSNDSMIEQEKWYQRFVTTDAGRKYLSDRWHRMLLAQGYPVEMSPDGAFRIEDVPTGAYTIGINVRGKMSQKHPAGQVIARGQADFTVPQIPGGRSDAPLRIAAVPIEMLPHVPSVGDPAPGFSVKTFDGKTISLSQYRGKYVLLEFWATWCGSCIAATPRLQDVYTRYGKPGQIAMISLSEDELPYAPSLYVRKHHLAWPQGFVGEESQTEKRYGVEGIPSFWIIGPDGRIVAKPRYDADLSAAIEQALGKTRSAGK